MTVTFHEVPALHRILVYGSLKTGYGNNETFLGESIFVKSVRTDEKRFDMVSLSSFPGVYSGGNLDIEGELWLVDDAQLVHIDALESNGRMYKRELVWLEGEDTPAWMYLYLNHELALRCSGKDFRVERSNGVVRWLPDPNPIVFSRFNHDSLWEKWGMTAKAAKPAVPASFTFGEDTSDDEEFNLDLEGEGDVEWCPEPETSEEVTDAAFDAMEQWLRNNSK